MSHMKDYFFYFRIFLCLLKNLGESSNDTFAMQALIRRITLVIAASFAWCFGVVFEWYLYIAVVLPNNDFS